MSELVGTLWCIGNAICIVFNQALLMSIIGMFFAVVGALISVIGNLINTLRFDHWRAIRLWTISSFMVATWAFGFLMGWWNGGVGVTAILGMNIVFFASNVWGLRNG